MKALELLAPAKDKNIGIAAIDCGADAVYIAAPAFGARAAAGNDLEDIEELCRYAHRYGARVFVTVNTIFYDSEVSEISALMEDIQRAGADAVIVQDMGLVQMILERKLSIDIPLHASTQCAIRTPQKAAQLAEAGFSRLILERQLSLEQVREIAQAAPECEIEAFVHGALCTGYSGQCYLSENLCSRSANRGVCSQACRSRYDLVDATGRVLERDRTLLSLKDYCLIDHLGDLAKAGVCSFKIEGRLKNESYVKNAVSAYSKQLDSIVAASEGAYCRASLGRSELPFEPNLDKTFNRGYTQFLFDKDFRRQSQLAGERGEYIGTVKAVSGNPQGCVITLGQCSDAVLANGDGLCFVNSKGETIGFRADKAEGTKVFCKSIEGLHKGLKIYRNLDTAFEKSLSRPVERLLDVDLSINIAGGRIQVRALREDGTTLERECIFDNTEKALNIERQEGIFRSCLGKKTLCHRFRLAHLSCDGGGLPLLSASQINGIRRSLAEELENLPVQKRAMLNRNKLLKSNNIEADSYKSNVSNLLASRFYGGVRLEAYELGHPSGAELMRTRHCIRRELGICLKDCSKEDYTKDTAQKTNLKDPLKGPLFLINNGRKLSLHFDCSNCEMIIKG